MASRLDPARNRSMVNKASHNRTVRSGRIARTRRALAIAIARTLRFRNEEKGATAVEFALVALPFTFVVISLMQLAMVFLLYSTLENALENASRGLRTGSNLPPTAAAFVSATCAQMGWLQGGCTSQLSVDVRTEAQFTNPSEPNPVQNGTFNQASEAYTNGTPGSILLVRAFYQWPVIAPVMDGALIGAGTKAVIVATTTFVVEPYSS